MTLILNNPNKLTKLQQITQTKNIILLVHATWCNTSKQFFSETWNNFKKVISRKYKNKIKVIELDSQYLSFKQKSKFLNNTLKDFKAYPTTIFISKDGNKKYLTGLNKTNVLEETINSTFNIKHNDKFNCISDVYKNKFNNLSKYKQNFKASLKNNNLFQKSKFNGTEVLPNKKEDNDSITKLNKKSINNLSNNSSYSSSNNIEINYKDTKLIV
jgi:hypothetical protein